MSSVDGRTLSHILETLKDYNHQDRN